MTALNSQEHSSAAMPSQYAGASAFDGVVVISPYYWNFRDDMYQTTHHMALEFARQWPTLFVEPAVEWNPRSKSFSLHRLAYSVFGARTRWARPDLLVFHRRGLFFGRHKSIRDFDLRRNARSLKALLKRLGFRRTLLWHSFPYWSEPLVEAVNPALLAYHCLDHATRGEERDLIRRADAVFCVSETLVEKHRLLNPSTYLLPNGVDLTLFDGKRAREAPRPADLPIHGRLIGFLGSINCHVDIELLVEVAKAYPKDHLILIGRIFTNENAPQGKQNDALQTLHSLSNVRVLGFKPTQQLAVYLNAFDVCLIPFLRNRFNLECDPLKFYQYSALGKPVVTTQVPLAKRYRQLCYVTDSTEEFVGSISLALGERDSARLCEERVALARAHSWETLVERARQLLSLVGKGNLSPASPSAN